MPPSQTNGRSIHFSFPEAPGRSSLGPSPLACSPHSSPHPPGRFHPLPDLGAVLGRGDSLDELEDGLREGDPRGHRPDERGELAGGAGAWGRREKRAVSEGIGRWWGRPGAAVPTVLQVVEREVWDVRGVFGLCQEPSRQGVPEELGPGLPPEHPVLDDLGRRRHGPCQPHQGTGAPRPCHPSGTREPGPDPLHRVNRACCAQLRVQPPEAPGSRTAPQTCRLCF